LGNPCLRRRGINPPSVTVIKQLLSKCPDVDVAFTALTMSPRPK
jgi:hypothetical protein